MSQIIADETPVPLEKEAKLVLHLIPLESFTPGRTVELVAYEIAQRAAIDALGFFGKHGWQTSRYNLDGKLMYTDRSTYVQVFRNGIVEAVDTALMNTQRQPPYIAGISLVDDLRMNIERDLRSLEILGLHPPLVSYITLIHVRGYILADGIRSLSSPRAPIDRDILELPEFLIQDFATKPGLILKPALDALWNAAGAPRCPLLGHKGERMYLAR